MSQSHTGWDGVKDGIQTGIGIIVLVFLAGASLWIVATTTTALIEGRSLQWWLSTDACPDPTITCGKISWATLLIMQVAVLGGIIIGGIRSWRDTK